MGDIITVGCKTSTGGSVITGSGHVKINGLSQALLGDTATCLCGSKSCRGQGPIVQQSSRAANINGTNVARVGDFVDTGCGNCYLIASNHNVSLGTSTATPLSMGNGISIGNGVSINTGGLTTTYSQSFSSPIQTQTNKVFAKSPKVPWGSIDVGQLREPASSIGSMGVYAAGSMDAVASTGLGATALSRISGVALADIAGFSMQVIGRSGVLLALSPTQLGDGTLYGQEEVKAKSGVETRVRFGFDTDGNIHGYHVDNAVIPNRTVERIGDKFVVDIEPGIRIEWVPTTTEIAGTKILTNPIPDIDLHTIYIHPEKDQGEEFANTYVTPISDVDLNDYILIFPEETGLPPLYIVYSKPPVKMLEVDLYGNFKGRPRNGTHADHMPSQAAAKAYLHKNLLGNISKKDIQSLMDFVATVIIPAKVHQKYSETYGGRNTPTQIAKDANNLRQAVDNNFDAIKTWMLEEGFNESELENARTKMHQLNKENGWYR
ncbi:S-type pyocin domain-containing protein (plasmid) [Photobacterium damselae subsp. damselae]|uniref:S-type pyocin domain-containing protein n=1 Tax=Photobacterium damselae TaxID=38293 RepID=UPI00311B0EE8